MSTATAVPAPAPAPACPPPAPPASAPLSEPFYGSADTATGLYVDGIIAVLSALDYFAREVEEYVEHNEDHIDKSEFDLDGDEIWLAQMVLAGLLADGGRFNDEGQLAWYDALGLEIYSWSLEEVIAKCDSSGYKRLIERFPDAVARELDRDPKARSSWVVIDPQ